MADNLESIKKKIAAMLAKANDTSVTEAEADAFNKKAHELMAKYNIARGELGPKEGPVERTALTMKVQLRPWSSYVLSGICKLYYCTYFSRKLDAKGRQHQITIIGEVQNAAVCHAISIMVLRSIQTAARSAGDGRSFMTGAGMEVHRRCNEMYSAVHAVLGPTNVADETLRLQHNREAQALTIVAQGEARGNQDYIHEVLGVRLAKAKKSTAKVRDISAMERGRQHGASVQLRRNLLS